MSAQNAEKLLDHLNSDPKLRSKLQSAGKAGFQAAASTAGYDCTPQEFADAVKKRVTSMDLKKEGVFTATDGVVSGVSSGVNSHVSAVGSGIA